MAGFKVKINGSSGGNTGERFRIKSINYGTTQNTQAQQEAIAKAQSDYKYATTPIIPTVDPTLRKLKGQNANTLQFNPIAVEGTPVNPDSGIRLVSQEVYDAAMKERERQTREKTDSRIAELQAKLAVGEKHDWRNPDGEQGENEEKGDSALSEYLESHKITDPVEEYEKFKNGTSNSSFLDFFKTDEYKAKEADRAKKLAKEDQRRIEYNKAYRTALNGKRAEMGLSSMSPELFAEYEKVMSENEILSTDNEYVKNQKRDNVKTFNIMLSAISQSNFAAVSKIGAETSADKLEGSGLKTIHNIINGVETSDSANRVYSMLTENEKAVWNYYIGAGKTEVALDYIRAMNPTLEARLAQTVSKEYDEQGFWGDVKEIGASLSGGFAKGGLDMMRAFGGVGDALGIAKMNSMQARMFEPTYAEQLANYVLADTNGADGKLFNGFLAALNSIAYQAPSMAFTAVGGGMAGYVMQGIGANTTEGIRNNTNSLANVIYGVYEGAMEYAVDRMLGGASAKLAGKGVGSLTKALLNHVDELVSNKTIRTLLSKGIIHLSTTGSEMLEEFIQTLAEPAARAVIYGEKMDYSLDTLKNALEAAMIGGIAGFIMGFATTKSTYRQYQSETFGNSLISTGKLDTLVRFAEDFGATDSTVYDSVKEAVENKNDPDALEVAQLYSQTMQKYNTFDAVDIARFVKNTANKNSVDDIANMLFNGNTEAAQKFVDKYSKLEIPSRENFNTEMPSVILGTAENYDSIQNIDEGQSQGYNENNVSSYENDVFSYENNDGGNVNAEQGYLHNGSERTGRTSSDTQVKFGEVQEADGGIQTDSREGWGNSGTLRNQGDNRGVTLSVEQNEKLKDTAVVNDDGTPKVVNHFTDNMDFDTFGEGDIGFHFGSESQALQHKENLKKQNKLKGEGRVILAHLAIKSPLKCSFDLEVWTPAHTAIKLYSIGVISHEQYLRVERMHAESGYDYNSPAAKELRKILSEKGYDGIEYENDHEGAGKSYIAFYPEQVIIINDGRGDTDTSTAPGENSDSPSLSDSAPTAGRVLDMPAISVKVQNFVKGIGKALGRKVEFVNMENFLKEHDINTEKLKIYPEGAIDGEGNIYLWYNAEKPVQFLFKHELTHFGERSKYYKRFVEFVRGSKIYEKWMREKVKTSESYKYWLKSNPQEVGKELRITQVEGFLKQDHINAQSKLKEEFGPDDALAEVIADFVGENCFGESLKGLEALIDEANLKQYPKAIQFLVDFFAYLKKKLSGNKEITFELSRIEDSFRRLITDANNTKTSDTNGGGIKYTIAGESALTADKLKLSAAQRGVAFNKDSESVRKYTGWYMGKDCKWRFYIPDIDMEFERDKYLSDTHIGKSSPSLIGNYVKHDKLFAAYPELKNITLRFEQRSKSNHGEYNASSNEIVLNELLLKDEDKLKTTLIHELQHAVQYIEGFATGGNKQIGLVYALNRAYEKVGKLETFKNLPSKEEKYKYLIDTAKKEFNATSYNDLRSKAYRAIYGEVEARESGRKRNFDENMLKISSPDNYGNVIDLNTETDKFIENFQRMGYTEEEIESVVGGIKYDQSRSDSTDAERLERELVHLRPRRNNIGKSNVRNIGIDGTSQEKSEDIERGVRSEVSDSGGRRTGSDLKFSVPTATENETDTDTQSTDFTAEFKTLMQSFQNGEISQDEYMRRVSELYQQSINENGEIPQGEMVTPQNKPFAVPKSVKDGTKVRQHVRTILESGMATEGQEGILAEQILSGKLSYTPTSDEKRIKSAESNIEKLGYQVALNNWRDKNAKMFTSDKSHVAEGEALLVLAFEHKNEADIVNLTAELAELGTRTAQNLQAMTLLKRMGGIAQLVYVQRCVSKINQDLSKRFKRRQENRGIPVPVVKLDETLAQQLAESKTEAEYEITYEAIMQDVAVQVPPTFLDKFNAWRYMAMLLNVTTHVRNFLGNAIFLPAIRIRNVLGKVMELTQDRSTRTKSIVVGKEYKAFARQDFEEVKDIISGGGKYNPSDSIDQYRRIFKTKWLEAARRFNFDLLEKADMIFLKAHYTHALGGYLQAQGIHPESVSSEQLTKARAYAMQEALKATYRDASKVANVLSQLSHSSKVANILIEGTMPFKKTPINIVKRGIEYSPVGLISTVGKGIDMLRGGEVTADQFIDGLAANLTGTGVFLLGMLLASLGVAKGGFDDEEKWFRQLNGEQEYSIEIAGKSYTISWASPVCIPFFIGVAAMEYRADEDGDFLSCATDLALTGFEPLLELSCLSGINDAIENLKYVTSGASIPTIVGNAAGSYLSQLLPTIGGKVANLFDDTRRTTYIDKTSDVPEIAQEALDKIASKTPFASRTRAEYINAWGETKYTGNFLQRFFQQFVSPGYASTVNVDDVSEELMRLYRQTDVSGLFPSTPQKYLKIRGERRDLSKEEYFNYTTFKGQTQADLVDEAIHSGEYAKLTDEQKAEVIKDIYSYAGALAKCQLEYSYEELAAMEGEDTKGNLILTEEKYNRLNDKARQILIDEYFMESSGNVKAYKTAKNGKSVVEYFCKKVKDN